MYNDVLRAASTHMGPAAKQLLDRAIASIGSSPAALGPGELPALADAVQAIAGKLLGPAKSGALHAAIAGAA